MTLRLEDFDFSLPGELIAQRPAEPRDAARLLHIGERLRDRKVIDLPDMLTDKDILVFNDTKVIPTRLKGLVQEKVIEITLHKPMDDATWRAFAKPAKRAQVGDRILFADHFHANVIEKHEGGELSLSFNKTGKELLDALLTFAHLPLPPYIKRESYADTRDSDAYQTVYARKEGAVAAPTAGLHFTRHLLKSIREKGIKTAFVTLHVGAGTFLPIKSQRIEGHKMHSEYAVLNQQTAATINAAKQAGGRVIAVGTTSLRLLESAVDEKGILHPFEGETDIFITPGYTFKCVDLLMTNFHLPKSTLLLLVSAFAGVDKIHSAYAHAIAQQYRFYSYGDACLLERQ